MSKEILIIRHGMRVDFEDRNWGKTAARPFDPPLSPTGLRQASETGAFLKERGISAVFASPFVRTLQTATAIADTLDLPIRVEAGIGEWLNPQWFKFDNWERRLEQLQAEFPRVDPTYQSLVTPRYPEITQDSCHARSAYVVHQLAGELSGNFTIVGHGATVQGMVLGLTGSDSGMNGHLCAVNVVRRSGSAWELREATTDHLSTAETTVRYQ